MISCKIEALFGMGTDEFSHSVEWNGVRVSQMLQIVGFSNCSVRPLKIVMYLIFQDIISIHQSSDLRSQVSNIRTVWHESDQSKKVFRKYNS